MPSFFRTAEDVRIYFLGLTNTPERKKQHRRLDTVYRQCIRRAGTRGHFFFHRRCSSLKGRPFLILESQGPVDRGIFQEGITRFGETLSGTFECPKPGYLILVVHRSVNAANVSKYSRIMRKLIAQLTGMMTSGGDDRVIIRTAEQAARMAKIDAKAREETARKNHETAIRLMEESPPPDPAQLAAQQLHAAQAVRRTWLRQVVDFRQADHHLQNIQAEQLVANAPVETLTEDEDTLRELRQRLATEKDPAGLQALMVELEGDDLHESLLAAITDSEDPLDAAQHWLDDQRQRTTARRAALQPQIERSRAITMEIHQQRQEMDQARRKIINDQADAIRQRIRDLQAASGPPEDLAAIQAELALVNRLKRADTSMRWIESSLLRMSDAGQTDEEAFAHLVKLDSTLRQSVSQLKQDVQALHKQGAEELLDTLWHQRPGISWARPMVEALLRA
ncbi:MAG: hypothetical protein ACI8RZ_001020 [Myxococcota bacterium]|jgi:hypothetical protein